MTDDLEPEDWFVLEMHQFGNGGVINSTDLAQKLAELVLEDIEGADEVKRARPWTVVDLGKVWHVKANPEAKGKDKHTAAWAIKIQKRDAKVLWFGRTQRHPVTPDMLKPPG